MRAAEPVAAPAPQPPPPRSLGVGVRALGSRVARDASHAWVTAALGGLLGLSGAAGLIYQVAWVRLLGLAFGVTIFAVSTVLAAFMGGLAIGSLLGGRWADRVRRPLRAYGLVELGVGATALLTPWAFGALQTIYASLAQVVDPERAPLVAGAVRASLAFGVLLVPTALMGATLPLAVRGARGTAGPTPSAAAGEDTSAQGEMAADRSEAEPEGMPSAAERARGDAWAMGLLYALNTCGAIVGCLLGGFVLIGRFGLAEAIAIAAATNTLAGLGGLVLSRISRPRSAPRAPATVSPAVLAPPSTAALSFADGPLADRSGPSSPAAAPPAPSSSCAEPTRQASREPSREDLKASREASRGQQFSGSAHIVTPPRLAQVAFWAFGVSGGISLAYEVVWSRTLAVLFDSSIYGFVLMLATVLAGIAIGGALGGALVRLRSHARLAGLALGWLEIGIGLAAVVALVAFGGAYDLLVALRDGGPPLLARFVRTDLRLMASLCVLTVLPAALLMGATFPLAARLWAAGAPGLGRRLGSVYAANVAGAIVGSLVAGFVLVPWLGAHHSLLLLAAGNVTLGCLVLTVARAAPSTTRPAWRGWPVVIGLAALGTIIWGASRPPLHAVVFAEHFPDQQLLAYWEGLENTVSVGRDADGIQTLFTNSRGQTNDAPDLVRYHRVMGHLAALLAPSAQPRALVVGLGAGATPGALAQHGGTQIDVVELSEAVIAAAPLFRVANADVLEQPNVHLRIDDGRNYLLRNRQPYDIITADVVHPYDAGATNLYSVEYFRAAAHALGPRGIMVQWVSPGSAFEHALIVRTFLQAFPDATLWLGGDLLVGSPSPLRVSRAELERRLADPAARASLAEVGLNHAPDVLAQLRATADELHAYAGQGPILTDDHPLLEYFASRDIPADPPDLGQFHGQLALDP